MNFKNVTPKTALLTMIGAALIFLGNCVNNVKDEENTREIVREELENIRKGMKS